MSSVRENLIAAKALIDTPEKFAASSKSKSAALYQVTSNWDEYFAADQTLDQHQVRGSGFASVMDQFDRAIASLPLHEGSAAISSQTPSKGEE